MRMLADIARLEEHRRALSVSEIAPESLHVGGGIASRRPAESWINSAVGLGMNGPVSGDDIDRVTAWYHEIGQRAQVEICPYADPSLMKLLAERGYAIHQVEQIMFRELRLGETLSPPSALGTGLTIRVVDPLDASCCAEVVSVIAHAFGRPERPTRPEDIEDFAVCAKHDRSVLFAAFCENACVGGGFVEVLGEIAALYGLGVAEAHRRRGIQQALIAARLKLATERGAKLATIGGPPGMGTERNVRRFGFEVAYTVANVRKAMPT